MKRFIVYSLLFMVWGNSVLGQNPEDTAAKTMDEVILTAHRAGQKSFYVPVSVNVLDSAFFADLQPRSTPEALMMVNGVFVQKTNHGGGSPFIRGLTGNQTLVLVDGIRLNNSTFRYGPNQYLNTIDPYNIERIEVAKGTGSVQYGTDALGGVVQVFTKQPSFSTSKPNWRGRVVGKYMSGDMEKTIRSEGQYSSAKFATIVGATYRDFGDLIGGDTTGRQSPSGYKEFAFDLKTRLLLKENLQVTLASQFLQQQDVDVYHKVRLENFAVNQMDPQRRTLNYAKLVWQTKSRLFQTIEAIGSWQATSEKRVMRKNGSNSMREEEDDVNTIGFTIDLVSSIRKGWTVNSGVESYADKVRSSGVDINTVNGARSLRRGLYPDHSSSASYSLYSLHHLSLNRFIVEAGLRFNTFSINIRDTSLGKVNLVPSAIVGNFGLLYSILPRHNIYINYSSGFRAPNIDDMGTLGIVDFRYEIPSYRLKPEASHHTELGYKLRTNRFSASIAGFRMRLENLITRVRVDGQMINGYQVYKKENTEKAIIKGVETEIHWKVMKQLSFSGGLSYTHGHNITKDEPLRRIPPFNARGKATWLRGKWFSSIEWMMASRQSRLAQGDRDDNRIPVGGTPGWNNINLYGGYRLAAFFLRAGLQNLFNEDYRTHGSGINAVGRSAWLSAAINFE